MHHTTYFWTGPSYKKIVVTLLQRLKEHLVTLLCIILHDRINRLVIHHGCWFVQIFNDIY